MKVGIFLATTSEKFEKRKYLEGFYNAIGNSCFLTKSEKYVECDIAIIFGFFGINLGKVQEIRKHIYDEHTSRGKKCIFIDADLFKHAGQKKLKENTHVRISYNSIYFDRAKHFNENSDNKRWNLIRKQKGIKLLNYRTDGDHILLCLNSNPYVGRGWSAGKIDIYSWAINTIFEIRKQTERPILIRFHPNAKPEDQKDIPIKNFLELDSNISFSGGINIKDRRVVIDSSLQDDCKNAWACITYNTSASVIPILNGIPTFTQQKNCPIYQIANHSLKNLNNPELIDRTQWLYDTSYCLWTYEEIKNGTVWSRFKSKLD